MTPIHNPKVGSLSLPPATNPINELQPPSSGGCFLLYRECDDIPISSLCRRLNWAAFPLLGHVNVTHGRVYVGVIHYVLNVLQVRAVCGCPCAERVPSGNVKPNVPQACIFQSRSPRILEIPDWLARFGILE